MRRGVVAIFSIFCVVGVIVFGGDGEKGSGACEAPVSYQRSESKDDTVDAVRSAIARTLIEYYIVRL